MELSTAAVAGGAAAGGAFAGLLLGAAFVWRWARRARQRAVADAHAERDRAALVRGGKQAATQAGLEERLAARDREIAGLRGELQVGAGKLEEQRRRGEVLAAQLAEAHTALAKEREAAAEKLALLEQ